MDNQEHYLKSFLISGLLMGALSSFPLFKVGNYCCVWQLLGGGLAGWILCRSAKKPVRPGEGILVGLFSGLIGGMIFSLVSSISFSLGANDWQVAMEQAFQSSGREIPPGIQAFMEGVKEWFAHPRLFLVIFMLFSLVIFAITAMIGSGFAVMIYEPRFALSRMKKEMAMRNKSAEQGMGSDFMGGETDLSFPNKKKEV